MAPMNPEDEDIQLDGIQVTHKKWTQQLEITVSPSDVKHKWEINLVALTLKAKITVTQGD